MLLTLDSLNCLDTLKILKLQRVLLLFTYYSYNIYGKIGCVTDSKVDSIYGLEFYRESLLIKMLLNKVISNNDSTLPTGNSITSLSKALISYYLMSSQYATDQCCVLRIHSQGDARRIVLPMIFLFWTLSKCWCRRGQII